VTGLVLSELFKLIWLIYGNVLYYSSSNDCMDKAHFQYSLMMVIIIFGYIQMLAYAIIIGVLISACVYHLMKKRN